MSTAFKQIFYTCAVLLLCCVGVLSTAECDTAKQHQEQCFSVLGLGFLDNVVKHSQDICRNQQLYAAAMRCALNVNTTCPSSILGWWSENWLDDDQIEEWISFFCSQVQDDRLMTLVPLNPLKFLPSAPRVRRDICTNPTLLQQAMKNCYTNEGIRFQIVDISSGAQSDQSITNSMFESIENLRALCSAGATVRQRANNCALGMARDCMPVGYKDLIQTPTQMNGAMEFLCSHIEEINFSCLNQKAVELYNCGYRKGLQIHSSDLKYIICRAYTATAECYQEVVPSCGCDTTRLYMKVVMYYLNPLACSAITVSAPVCAPGTDYKPSSAPSFLLPGTDTHAAHVGCGSLFSASVAALVSAAFLATVFSV